MNHYEKHIARVSELKSDDFRSVTIYESDGSDGYTPGTWGY